MRRGLVASCLAAIALHAQEAPSGFELRATLSGLFAASNELMEDPRSGSGAAAGFRSVFYPVWKLDEHWTVSGAYQAVSRPYFFESFSTQGYGVKGSVLQATLNYSRSARSRSLVFRMGELSTAFGAFSLRYDDAANPLVGLPLQYGYYYATVSTLPVAGAQLDAASGKWDGRLQFVNSSPANPRGVFARDQYGNWAGGGGYTIRQGFRVGASGYRGPYLDRKYRYFFPGEAKPADLPASAVGLDVQWAKGHWNLQGELQRFVLPYRAIPVFREKTSYIEATRVLHPRWYVAERVGFLSPSAGGDRLFLETVAGFRPAANQIVKLSYQMVRSGAGEYRTDHTLAIQLVAGFRPISCAWR
jgi:hypothetical protein